MPHYVDCLLSRVAASNLARMTRFDLSVCVTVIVRREMELIGSRRGACSRSNTKALENYCVFTLQLNH
jgi:hypothetical protein